LSRLASNRIVVASSGQWRITNLGALAAAKRLSAVSSGLGRKAPRFVVYDGVSKASTRTEHTIDRGLAVGFQQLVELVHAAAPRNRVIEQAIRTEVQMFPQQALRELIANALIHQDFTVTGARVMIELFNDRVQITNPGIPPISLDRFIDEYRSRNESFADLLRRMGICEEKSSGIDRVVQAAELYQLPAPDFRSGFRRTSVTIFGPRLFEEMDRNDRVRACYQHCALKWVMSERMTNQSLRERFHLAEDKAAIASQVIAATIETGLIKPDESVGGSRKFARYLPFWA
jgi:ATP-dependent DNA helicase RecG